MVGMLSYSKLITEHSVCDKIHGTPEICTILHDIQKKVSI